ncbi:nucleotide exchange factor GrpE [Saccharopolyspora sp. TS4A08]|uniref:Nucleotide exchange factor GrpE n=2 Tax=Saccharopolyspora ipomoeae TaxID=3042027 RepID=A0ABT6PTF3_9PSEU|nr:nucleotide exchange factor GrpE [Saccharopolyspora sp. TS4A08]MDI2031272.1 nucleotide exchange factor GrpE [Saccharopolyspora sp. TS4A08]
MTVRSWRRSKKSPESGTEVLSGPSDPHETAEQASDADADQGTDMTAVTSETVIDPLEQALTDRAALIQLCVYAVDRARSAGVAERLADGLTGIGVTALRPDGERFDPGLHEAGGTLPTDDPELDGVIAETELLGFADRDRVLRTPVVTVYQLRR